MPRGDASRRLEQCSPRQLSELLSLAESTQAPRQIRTVASPDFDRQLAAVEIPGFGTADAVVDLLCASDTPLETYRAVKRATKSSLRALGSAPERDVLIYIYHVAVAAAFVRHGAVISSRTLANRLSLYEGLAEAVRKPAPARVFHEASVAIGKR